MIGRAPKDSYNEAKGANMVYSALPFFIIQQYSKRFLKLLKCVNIVLNNPLISAYIDRVSISRQSVVLMTNRRLEESILPLRRENG